MNSFHLIFKYQSSVYRSLNKTYFPVSCNEPGHCACFKCNATPVGRRTDTGRAGRKSYFGITVGVCRNIWFGSSLISLAISKWTAKRMTGANRNKALVAVSSGLLANMSRDEAEAVLGHEVSHVANGDMITLALIQGVVNTFVIFHSRVIGHLVDRVIFNTERGHGSAFWVTAIVAELVLGVLAGTIVMWFSRKREFRADAGGARLASRQKMIQALERLRQSSGQAHLPDVDGGLWYCRWS